MRLFLLPLVGALGCAGGDMTDQTDTTDVTGPECAVEERDCAGVCFGDSVEDDCGRCDDDPTNDCSDFTVVNGSWTCKPGITCQDVWEVELPGSTDVTIRVREVSGDSVVRLGAFAPDSRPGGVNVLVGRNKDLACWGVDEDAEATFRAPERGTWRIVVGRDDAASDGMFGAYTLEVESSEGLTLRDAPLRDDDPTESVGQRCGNEYVFEQVTWDCRELESCQDSFEVSLESGTRVDLAITEVGDSSVAGLGLYGPGNDSGDTNLLTNTRDDRVCADRGEEQIAPSFEVTADGTYTVTATRISELSTGDQGRYTIAIGADAFFDRPQPDDNDLRTGASGTQCEWSFDASAAWACKTDETCQDVYEIELPAGTQLGALVRNVTGSSVVRAALFEPGVKRSGINQYTGGTTDYACFSPGENAPLPVYDVPTDGTYQLAVGRDSAASTGTMGSYDLRVEVRDGYGLGVQGILDDEVSLATGAECL